MSRTERITSGLVGILVIGITAAAFWLSFDAIRSMAILQQVAEGSAWLVPMLVDGTIVVFSIVRLYAALIGEKNTERVSVALIVLAVLVSVILNTVKADGSFDFGNWVSLLIHSLPPLALLCSFEMFMFLVHAHVRRNGHIVTLADLKQRVQELNNQRSGVAAEIETLNGQLNKVNETLNAERQRIEREAAEHRQKLNADIERLKAQISELKSEKTKGDLNEAQQLLLAYVRNHPNASYSEIGEVIGRAPSTVSGYVKDLTERGIIHANGNGIEVQA